jgi:hypothetical protein
MRNIHEVLKAKEQLVEQGQRDIEILRQAIRLLSEEREESGESMSAGGSSLSSTPAPPVVMRAAAGAKDSRYSGWDAGSKQFP